MTLPPSGTGEAEPIPAALAGERLDRVVSMMTSCSRREASDLIDAGLVEVNGVVAATRSLRLAEGDGVAVTGRPQISEPPSADVDVLFEVVHEDPSVVVVDKPAGLVVHPGAGHRGQTLVNGLLHRFPDLGENKWADQSRPGIVHRIDRDTSGLLMVARTLEAYESLTSQLSQRTVERRYLALVWGRFEAPAGEIDGPIARSIRDPTKMTVSASGREARTGYLVERTFLDPVEATLLSCTLFTGRTHQIRVHMRSIGHPVVGDARYGGRRQSLSAPRFFLHATTLGFDHPVSGDRLRFESDLPPDLSRVLDSLR